MDSGEVNLKVGRVSIKESKYFDDNDDSSIHDSDLDLVCCFGKFGRTEKEKLGKPVKDGAKLEVDQPPAKATKAPSTEKELKGNKSEGQTLNAASSWADSQVDEKSQKQKNSVKSIEKVPPTKLETKQEQKNEQNKTGPNKLKEKEDNLLAQKSDADFYSTTSILGDKNPTTVKSESKPIKPPTPTKEELVKDLSGTNKDKQKDKRETKPEVNSEKKLKNDEQAGLMKKVESKENVIKETSNASKEKDESIRQTKPELKTEKNPKVDEQVKPPRRTLGSLFSVKKEPRREESGKDKSKEKEKVAEEKQVKQEVKAEKELADAEKANQPRRTLGSLFSVKKETRTEESKKSKIEEKEKHAESKQTKQEVKAEKELADAEQAKQPRRTLGSLFSIKKEKVKEKDANSRQTKSEMKSEKEPEAAEQAKAPRRTLGSLFSTKKEARSKESEVSENKENEKDAKAEKELTDIEQAKAPRRTFGSLFSMKKEHHGEVKENSRQTKQDDKIDKETKEGDQVKTSRRTLGSLFSVKKEKQEENKEKEKDDIKIEKELKDSDQPKPQRRTLGSLFSLKKTDKEKEIDSNKRPTKQEVSSEKELKDAEKAKPQRRTLGSLFSVKKESNEPEKDKPSNELKDAEQAKAPRRTLGSLFSVNREPGASNEKEKEANQRKAKEEKKLEDEAKDTEQTKPPRRTLGSLFSVKKEPQTSQDKENEATKMETKPEKKSEHELKNAELAKPQRRTLGSLFSVKKEPLSSKNETDDFSSVAKDEEATRSETKPEKDSKPQRRTLGSLFSVKKEPVDKEKTEPESSQRRTLGSLFASKLASDKNESVKPDETEKSKDKEPEDDIKNAESKPPFGLLSASENVTKDQQKEIPPIRPEGKRTTFEDLSPVTKAERLSDPPVVRKPFGLLSDESSEGTFYTDIKQKQLTPQPSSPSQTRSVASQVDLPTESEQEQLSELEQQPESSVQERFETEIDKKLLASAEDRELKKDTVAKTEPLTTASDPSSKASGTRSVASQIDLPTESEEEHLSEAEKGEISVPAQLKTEKDLKPIDDTTKQQVPIEMRTVASQADLPTDPEQEQFSEQEILSVHTPLETKALSNIENQPIPSNTRSVASEADFPTESEQEHFLDENTHEDTKPWDVSSEAQLQRAIKQERQSEEIIKPQALTRDELKEPNDTPSAALQDEVPMLTTIKQERLSDPEEAKVLLHSQIEAEADADIKPLVIDGTSVKQEKKEPSRNSAESFGSKTPEADDQSAHMLHEDKSFYKLSETCETEYKENLSGLSLKQEELEDLKHAIPKTATEKPKVSTKVNNFTQTDAVSEGSYSVLLPPTQDPNRTRGVQTDPYRFLDNQSSEKMLAPTGAPIGSCPTSKSTQTDCVCNYDSSMERMNTLERNRAARTGSKKQNKLVQTDICLCNYISSSEEDWDHEISN